MLVGSMKAKKTSDALLMSNLCAGSLEGWCGLVWRAGTSYVPTEPMKSEQFVQFCHRQKVALTRHLEATTSSPAFSMASKHGIRSICT